MGRRVKGCGPNLRARGGKGWRTCLASGFVRYAEDYVDDVRQGAVAPEFADQTPGFGTHHPQDVKNLPTLDDPSVVENAQPGDTVNATKADLGISDQEVRASIVEGRSPRIGF